MSKKKTLFFSKASTIPPNTFIGGVGASTVTSAADYAALTDLFEEDIQSFNIDANNNVSFYVDKDYVILASSFDGNSQVRYLIDLDSNIGFLGIAGFRNCTNISSLFGENIISGSSSLRNVRKIKYLNLPSNSNWSTGSFLQLRDVEIIRLQNNTGGSASLVFGSAISVKHIWLPQVINYPNPANNANQIFININNGAKIYVQPQFLTSNAGQPEPALQYAVDNSSAILVGINNTTPPNAITDLSSISIQSTTCEIDFTTPTSTNTIQFYEVWVERQDLGLWEEDRVFERYNHHQIINFGDSLIVNNLNNSTTYNIKVFVNDEYCNRSEFSNEITITTL